MKFSNPNPKAEAAKKFIKMFYPNVDRVEVSYYTEDIPSLKVYFYQDDVRIANAGSVFREEIIKDLRHYLGVRAVNEFLFNWEMDDDYKKNPEMYVKALSLNYDPTA